MHGGDKMIAAVGADVVFAGYVGRGAGLTLSLEARRGRRRCRFGCRSGRGLGAWFAWREAAGWLKGKEGMKSSGLQSTCFYCYCD